MRDSTPKVRLRKVRPSDASVLAKWMRKPRVPRILPGLKHASFRKPETWRLIAKSKIAKHFLLITAKSTGKPIGLSTLYKVNPKDRTCFGGMALFEESHRSKGCGFAAKLLQLKYAFQKLGAKKVYSKVPTSNKRVIRGLGYCGYREASLKTRRQFGVSSAKQKLLVLSRGEWKSRIKSLESHKR